MHKAFIKAVNIKVDKIISEHKDLNEASVTIHEVIHAVNILNSLNDEIGIRGFLDAWSHAGVEINKRIKNEQREEK